MSDNVPPVTPHVNMIAVAFDHEERLLSVDESREFRTRLAQAEVIAEANGRVMALATGQAHITEGSGA